MKSAVRDLGARPRRLAWFLARAFPDAATRRALVGDLNEVYAGTPSKGPGPWFWYWGQMALIVVHGLGQRGREFSPSSLPRPLDGMRQEVTLSLRVLRRHWALSLSAVLTMGLGLGLNLLVLALAESTVLSEFPYPDSPNLYALKGHHEGYLRETLSLPELKDYAEGCAGCREVGVYRPGIILAMRRAGRTLPAQAGFVSPSYFRALGVPPLQGRTFTEHEDSNLEASGVAVLSYDFWVRSLSQSPEAVGNSIALSGRRFQIAGIMPPDFLDLNSLLPWERESQAIGPVDVWLPLSAAPPFLGPRSRVNRWTREYRGVVRVGSHSTVQEASRQLEATAARLRIEHPDVHENWSVRLMRLERHFHATTRRALPLLLAGSGLLLLMCCVNLWAISHVLTRSQGRPLAVSLALGAGRLRLLRRLAVQVALLSLGGAGVAWLLWTAALRGAVWWSPSLARASGALAADWSNALTLLAVLSMCAGAGSLRPVLRMSARPGPIRGSLLEDGAGSPRRGGAVIVLEVAAAVMLTATAGLMIKSIHRLSSTPLGFEAERLLTFRLDLSNASLSGDTYPQRLKRVALARRLLQGTRDLPDVESAALVAPNPLGQASWLIGLTPTHLNPAVAANRSWPQRIVVTPGAFSTLGLTLLEGRGFTDSDRMGSQLVAVIDEGLARKHWPGESALGKQFYSTHEPTWSFRVVGVVSRAKHRGRLSGNWGDVYLSYYQTPWKRASATVRLRGDAKEVAGRIRAIANQVMPEVVLFDFVTMEERLKRLEAAPRLITALLCSYALLTMMLGLLGILGILTHSVLRRRREIALRGVLGASRETIAWWILRRGFLPLAAGTLGGLGGGLVLARLLRGFLYQVAPFDWTVHLGFSSAVLLLSLAACLPAALMAARIDPMRVLRA